MQNTNVLSPDFLHAYQTRLVNWGFPSGPNSLGEVTYRRTYARNGEAWWQTVARVVEGTYEILRGHCARYCLPFDLATARADAAEMYERIFSFKFTPPGRGLWMMGTDFVRERGGAGLNNCGYVSTENIAQDHSKAFRFLMDMSMLGVGIGFDTRGAGKIRWAPIRDEEFLFVVDDSREGWVKLWGSLLDWGFGCGHKPLIDVGQVRKAGTPIRGFGGVASGPAPLVLLYQRTLELIERRAGQLLSSRDIVDLMNFAGACVVAGNVRRTAEIAFGDAADEEFLDLKNYDKNGERAEYGWTSNNSVFATVGMDYAPAAARTRSNGEPGYFWLENAQAYGRMKDPPDHKDRRVRGTNPCGEQSLESYELCTLVETFPHLCKDLDDYRRTLKYAYLYAKAVTLLPTHWSDTNAVLLRNRRIGCSVSGVVQFLTAHSEAKLIRWLDEGYQTVNHYDRVYSEWLCVRESVKKTSVKPSGTVSLLAGATPGAHYPTHRCYVRRIRFATDHPDVVDLKAAGYPTEPDVRDPSSVVVEFPVKGPDVPTEQQVSLGRKVHLAALLQRHWADNQVSYTATFDPDKEGHLIEDVLQAYDSRLKAISFLPLRPEGAYPQMPYEAITEEEYVRRSKDLRPVLWSAKDAHDQEDKYCDGGACEIRLPQIVATE